MLAQILEAAMMVTFGCSWPINAYKGWQARTAVGTSWQFLFLITLGYIVGIASKFAGNNLNWVLIVYVLNLLFLCVNWGVYARNLKLDRQRVRDAAVPNLSGRALDRVIVASDGSEGSFGAARFAAGSLGIGPRASLTVLSVAPDASEEAQRRARETVELTEKILAEGNTECTGTVRTGNAAAEIVRAAEEAKADIIVMGSRGLSGLETFLLGSVSRGVANKAGCPVLIVK